MKRTLYVHKTKNVRLQIIAESVEDADKEINAFNLVRDEWKLDEAVELPKEDGLGGMIGRLMGR